MLRTKIYSVSGFRIDVQESVEEVKKLVARTATGGFIAFTLELGGLTYIACDHIICFTKY